MVHGSRAAELNYQEMNGAREQSGGNEFLGTEWCTGAERR